MSVTFYIASKTQDNDPRDVNVANANARLILYGLLGYGHEEVDPSIGDLDPDDVLRRLAVGETKIAQLVRPRSDNYGVDLSDYGVRAVARAIECGCDEEQIESYVERLRELAQWAIKAGKKISYA